MLYWLYLMLHFKIYEPENIYLIFILSEKHPKTSVNMEEIQKATKEPNHSHLIVPLSSLKLVST